MSAPPSPTSTGVPAQQEQKLNLQPDNLPSTSHPLTPSNPTTSNIITRALAPILTCLPSSRHNRLRKPRPITTTTSTTTPSTQQPSKQLPYAPTAAPPTLHFPTLSCPYLPKYPAPSHHPSNPAPLPLLPPQTPTPNLHLRGGSSNNHSSTSNPASSHPPNDGPNDAPANHKNPRKRTLADNERAPALLWWFAGGRSFPPPTGKQLRAGKRVVRDREVVYAEMRAAKKEKKKNDGGGGGGGVLGRLFGKGKGKGEGEGGADGDAGGGGVGGGG
ncbi:MAG: hypothetical protein M1835_007007, partial [Candelina submexicana]